MKNRPVNVIFNPVAGGGKGRRLISDILSMMKNRFDSEVLLWETQRSGDAAMFARGIVLSDNDLIIIVGGDGTINETVNGLIENVVACAQSPEQTARAAFIQKGWEAARAEIAKFLKIKKLVEQGPPPGTHLAQVFASDFETEESAGRPAAANVRNSTPRASAAWNFAHSGGQTKEPASTNNSKSFRGGGSGGNPLLQKGVPPRSARV